MRAATVGAVKRSSRNWRRATTRTRIGGRGDDGGGALPARAQQADLAEEVTGPELSHALAVAMDVRRARDDDEELLGVAALARQLSAGGHADLVGQARQVPAAPSGDVGEERDRCDGAQFHGARLSVRDRGMCS
jgi:hypothetical protein